MSVASSDANAAPLPPSEKQHEFLWTATVEPHAARRKAILAAHGDEVRKLYGYDVWTAVQVRKLSIERAKQRCRAPTSKMLPFSAPLLLLSPSESASSFLPFSLRSRRWPGLAEAMGCLGCEPREQKTRHESTKRARDKSDRRRRATSEK